MTVAEKILLRNADNGVTFYRDRDALKWEPPVTFAPNQLACIEKHKGEILELVDADEIISWLELPCARIASVEMVGITGGK